MANQTLDKRFRQALSDCLYIGGLTGGLPYMKFKTDWEHCTITKEERDAQNLHF